MYKKNPCFFFLLCFDDAVPHMQWYPLTEWKTKEQRKVKGGVKLRGTFHALPE